jgi:hypothetical protein
VDPDTGFLPLRARELSRAGARPEPRVEEDLCQASTVGKDVCLRQTGHEPYKGYTEVDVGADSRIWRVLSDPLQIFLVLSAQ